MKTKLLDLALIVVILVFAVIIYRQIQDLRHPPGNNIQHYQPEEVSKKVLYEPPAAAAEVSQTLEDSGAVAVTKLPNLENNHPKDPAAMLTGGVEAEQIQDFIMWAEERGIKLKGIKKNAHDIYYEGVAAEDFLPLEDIPNLLEAAKGLYEIPESLLTVMEGKTYYLSSLPGRGYTILGTWSKDSILAKIDRGSILEQRLSKRQTIHEFAHILDYHGIQGTYGDTKNFWFYLKELRDEIFTVPFAYDRKRPAVPPGYLDIYSTANAAENFAQHFMYYILYGPEFRKKAENDELLQKKYDFFKENLFDYVEYGL